MVTRNNKYKKKSTSLIIMKIYGTVKTFNIKMVQRLGGTSEGVGKGNASTVGRNRNSHYGEQIGD